MDNFSENDLVAVFGGEMGKEKHTADTVTLCKVLVVGQNDLIVESFTSYSSTYHTVPKAICFKLHLDPETLSSAEMMVPQIGDLVVSYSRGFSVASAEKTSGILYKVNYRLGQPDRCDLLCGTDMVTVSWESLMVLHRPEPSPE